tara:strand:- start:26 stop:280 length:255 start_codon:yes stop_codon:yes gene_type:complete
MREDARGKGRGPEASKVALKGFANLSGGAVVEDGVIGDPDHVIAVAVDLFAGGAEVGELEAGVGCVEDQLEGGESRHVGGLLMS